MTEVKADAPNESCHARERARILPWPASNSPIGGAFEGFERTHKLARGFARAEHQRSAFGRPRAGDLRRDWLGDRLRKRTEYFGRTGDALILSVDTVVELRNETDDPASAVVISPVGFAATAAGRTFAPPWSL